MKKLRLFPLILIFTLLLVSSAPAAFALDDPVLDAKRVILVDLNTDRILFSREMNEQVAPASLTKVMTVLLAVEAVEDGRCSLDDMVTAQNDCRVGMDEDSSTAGIMPGEQMSFENLLYCAMLASANEACNIIATHVDGSISAFVDSMNQKAQELGCADTHFANTNGLSDDTHRSSAYDLYLITKEAMTHPVFYKVCNTAHYEVPATNMSDVRKLDNSNALISSGSIYGSGYLYEYASGVKTGYTNAAGYCLISTAEKDGVHLLAVVMGCKGPNNTNWTVEEVGNFVNTKTLYNWAFDNFSYRNVLSRADVLTTVDVALSEGSEQAVLCPQEDITVLLPTELPDSDIQKVVTVYEDRLTAPIDPGTVLGEVTISANGESFGTIMLVNTSRIDLSKSEYLRQKLGDFFSNGWVILILIIVAILVFGYLILVARYRRLRRKHLREKRLAEQRRRERMERAYQNTYQNAAPQSGAYRSDPYRNGAYQNGSYQNAPYRNGAYQNGYYQDSSYQNGYYQNPYPDPYQSDPQRRYNPTRPLNAREPHQDYTDDTPHR